VLQSGVPAASGDNRAGNCNVVESSNRSIEVMSCCITSANAMIAAASFVLPFKVMSDVTNRCNASSFHRDFIDVQCVQSLCYRRAWCITVIRCRALFEYLSFYYTKNA